MRDMARARSLLPNHRLGGYIAGQSLKHVGTFHVHPNFIRTKS